MRIDVVGFVNDGQRRDILLPILAKLAIFTAMITLAMVLFYSNERWAGILLYVKEVMEFALFIFYLRKRRKVR